MMSIDKTEKREAFSFAKETWGIPKYQRPYTWDIEPDVSRLWEDLNSNFLLPTLADERRVLPEDLRRHFFGVIFYSTTNGVKSLEDGQQRATALKCLRIASRIFGNQLREVVQSEHLSNSNTREITQKLLSDYGEKLKTLGGMYGDLKRDLVLDKFFNVNYSEKKFGSKKSISAWKKSRKKAKQFQELPQGSMKAINELLKNLEVADGTGEDKKVSSVLGCDKAILECQNSIVSLYDEIVTKLYPKLRRNEGVQYLLKKRGYASVLMKDLSEDKVYKKDKAKKIKAICENARNLEDEVENLIAESQMLNATLEKLGDEFLNWKQSFTEDEIYDFGLVYELNTVNDLSDRAIKIASDYLNDHSGEVGSSVVQKLLQSEDVKAEGFSLAKAFRAHRKKKRNSRDARLMDNSLMVQRLSETIVFFFGNFSKLYFENSSFSKKENVKYWFEQLIFFDGQSNKRSVLRQGLEMFNLIQVPVNQDEAQQFFRNINSRGKTLSGAEQIRNMLIVAEQTANMKLSCFSKSIQVLDIDRNDDWPLRLQNIDDYLVEESLKILSHKQSLQQFNCKSKSKRQLVDGVDKFILKHRGDIEVIDEFLGEFNGLMEDFLEGYKNLQKNWSKAQFAVSMQKLHLDTILLKWQLVLGKKLPKPHSNDTVRRLVDKLSFIFWWVYKRNDEKPDAFPEIHYSILSSVNSGFSKSKEAVEEVTTAIDDLMKRLLEKCPFDEDRLVEYLVPRIQPLSNEMDSLTIGKEEDNTGNHAVLYKSSGNTDFYKSGERKNEARWLLWHYERSFGDGDKVTGESLEHIHPKSIISGEFEHCKDVINALGNFILLSEQANSSLGKNLIKMKLKKFKELTAPNCTKSNAFTASAQANELFNSSEPLWHDELGDSECFGPELIRDRSLMVAKQLYKSFSNLLPPDINGNDISR